MALKMKKQIHQQPKVQTQTYTRETETPKLSDRRSSSFFFFLSFYFLLLSSQSLQNVFISFWGATRYDDRVLTAFSQPETELSVVCRAQQGFLEVRKQVSVIPTRLPPAGLSHRFQQHCKTLLQVLRDTTLCSAGPTATDGGKEAASAQEYHRMLHTSSKPFIQTIMVSPHISPVPLNFLTA